MMAPSKERFISGIFLQKFRFSRDLSMELILLFLFSWVALRTGALPKVLSYLGVLIGAAGLVTVIPAFGEVGGSLAWV